MNIEVKIFEIQYSVFPELGWPCSVLLNPKYLLLKTH